MHKGFGHSTGKTLKLLSLLEITNLSTRNTVLRSLSIASGLSIGTSKGHLCFLMEEKLRLFLLGGMATHHSVSSACT